MISLRQPTVAALLFVLAGAAGSPRLRAQAEAPPVAAPPVKKLVDLLMDPDLQAEAKKLAEEPQIQKQLLDSFLKKWGASDNSLSGLLKDLHLEPKILSVKNSPDDTIVGIAYSYDRAMANRVINPEKRDPLGFALKLRAKGTVTTTASQNPNNFLESAIDFSLFQAIGGVEPIVGVTDEVKTELTKLAVDATNIKNGNPDFRSDPRYQAAVKHFAGHVLPQALWYVAGSGTLESDQQFKQKQWAYGLTAGLSVRDWRSESWVSWINLPDYPFALLRGLTDHSEPVFQPSGHSFPTLVGGIDLVDPKDNKDRLAVDPDKSKYQRLRGEIGFKTKVAKVAGQVLWFSASYRVFVESSPSAAIKAAKLDKFEYVAARLDLGEHFFVTYTTGKLPLDRQSDKVYELGYKFSL